VSVPRLHTIIVTRVCLPCSIDGSGGVCASGFQLGSQALLNATAKNGMWVGRFFRTKQPSDCCIYTADVAASGSNGYFTEGVAIGHCNPTTPTTWGYGDIEADSCSTLSASSARLGQGLSGGQATFCSATPCQSNEVLYNSYCYYLDSSGGLCASGYALGSQTELVAVSQLFSGMKMRSGNAADNCCITTSTSGRLYGLDTFACPIAGPFFASDIVIHGGNNQCSGVDGQSSNTPKQATFCKAQTAATQYLGPVSVTSGVSTSGCSIYGSVWQYTNSGSQSTNPVITGVGVDRTCNLHATLSFVDNR
jgi:hypothetical protein